MRKHGWQLPYHPLQVVAVSVFLALGFAFYVFFAPFVGKKMLQYIAMGIYTPLITCAFSLYIWCAAADPADPGVFKSKRYLKIPGNGKHAQEKDSKLGGQSISSMQDGKSTDTNLIGTGTTEQCQKVHARSKGSSRFFCALLPCTLICKCCISSEESSEHQMSEDAMFYCSLCEVEVNKYSKHCRVCDKCIDRFDHHCRWINNCIGKKNYRKFFTLMVSALLLLILQWSTGILVLISCFLERKRFYVDIAVKLGSSFSLVPFVIVVGMCTLLAMIATLPLAQLFFFHILLIKKGISTYDYIVALREQDQEQQGIGGHQSAQMSPMSSITGLSSASSFSTFHRAGAWCTPPRLFVEDQFDAIPPENASVSSFGKKNVEEEPMKKKNQGAVKISPWTLARLNAEEVTRAAAEARKRSKILKPVMRQESAPFRPETGTSFLNSGHQVIPRPENSRKRANKMANLPPELSTQPFTNISTSFAPLQLEARSAFQTSRAMSSSTGVVGSSPESSLDSPDIRPFQAVPMGAEEPLAPPGLSAYSLGASRGLIQVSRNSTSDGYEASGGEDSDRVPSRFVHRSTNWSNLMSSSSQLGNRKF